MSTVLALDPSGNYKEGKGITGWCLSNNGKVYAAGQVYSTDYPSQFEYWKAVIDVIARNQTKDYVVVCEDYRLYASAAKAQINSNLETPQLIGAIRYFCGIRNIFIYMQMASEVKTRWSNEVLLESGIIKRTKSGYKIGNVKLEHHSMDALRHNLHYCNKKHLIKKKKEKREYARY